MFFAANQSGLAAAFGPDIGKATSAAERIFKIIDQKSRINAEEIDKDSSKIRIKDPESISGRIEFKDVWFRYPTRKQDFVLRGLSLTIEPEERVALVGESGCGKSTFVNLMMRFYDVNFGEILLDGVNIKDYNLHDLRRTISLVMQEPVVFNYSILENILYGDLDAKNSQVDEAARVSNCHEFINNIHAKTSDSAQTLLTEMEKNKKELV
jgi:ATP-binding cassette subfamily B (MDR/TAP) protein 1